MNKIENERKKAEAFALAKVTGEAQVIEQRYTPCYRIEMDCLMDMVTVYVLPSGEIEERRRHIWSFGGKM